jgi:hypothetical protein
MEFGWLVWFGSVQFGSVKMSTQNERKYLCLREDLHCSAYCFGVLITVGYSVDCVTLWLYLFIPGTISPHQKKLQEAKFEIITSEASYINSLNVLEKHFISSLELCDESVLSKNDRRTLFSNLIPGNLNQYFSLH